MLLITTKTNGDMIIRQRKICSIDFCHLTLTIFSVNKLLSQTYNVEQKHREKG